MLGTYQVCPHLVPTCMHTVDTCLMCFTFTRMCHNGALSARCLFIQGAGETGQAEAYFNSRIMRNPRVKGSIARYMGEFVADKSDGGFIKGTQWLVWKFESDSTLSDAMQVCCLPCVQLQLFVMFDHTRLQPCSLVGGNVTCGCNS